MTKYLETWSDLSESSSSEEDDSDSEDEEEQVVQKPAVKKGWLWNVLDLASGSSSPQPNKRSNHAKYTANNKLHRKIQAREKQANENTKQQQQKHQQQQQQQPPLWISNGSCNTNDRKNPAIKSFFENLITMNGTSRTSSSGASTSSKPVLQTKVQDSKTTIAQQQKPNKAPISKSAQSKPLQSSADMVHFSPIITRKSQVLGGHPSERQQQQASIPLKRITVGAGQSLGVGKYVCV
jgi:hypothetical protein